LNVSDSAKLDPIIDLSEDVDSGGDSEEDLIEVVEYDFNMDENVKFRKKVVMSMILMLNLLLSAFLALSPSYLPWWWTSAGLRMKYPAWQSSTSAWDRRQCWAR
jgi:hypothetical protein